MIASSALTLYLALIGLSISGFFGGVIVPLPPSRRNAAMMVLPLFCGLLVNLLVFLVVRRLLDSMLICATVAVTAALTMLWIRMRMPAGAEFTDRGPCASSKDFWCLLAVACGVIAYLVMQLFEKPVVEWDARSIWFLQGKMIYFAGGMRADDFTLPGVQFGNMDYPKQVSLLASQVAFLNGYWNEYQPLSAVAVLLTAEILLIAYATGTALRFLVVVVLWTVLAGKLGRHGLLNGYADAHLAAFALGAALCFQRWLDKSSVADAIIGILALGLVASLKNEGLVIALIISLAAIAAGYRAGALSRLQPRLPLVSGAILLAALPALTWQIVKFAWQLKPDVLQKVTLARSASRLNAADLLEITTHLNILWPAAVSVCMFATHYSLLRRREKPAEFPFYCAAAYYLVLAFVYIITPYDLKWHLDTSADRVVMAVHALLIGGIAAHLWSVRKYVMSRKAVELRR